MTNVKSIVQIFFSTLFIGVLGAVIFMFATSKTSFIGGMRSFIVLTGSMEPTLPVGSIVFTKKSNLSGDQIIVPIPDLKQNNANYAKGDIVSFQKGEVTVTHRIVGIEKSAGSMMYKTRGDANNTDDSQLVAESSIIGKRLFSLPYAGKITSFVQSLPGFILLIIFPSVLYIVFEIVNIVKDLEENIRRKYQGEGQIV